MFEVDPAAVVFDGPVSLGAFDRRVFRVVSPPSLLRNELVHNNEVIMTPESQADGPFAIHDLWRKSAYTLADATEQSLFKDVDTGTRALLALYHCPFSSDVLTIDSRSIHRTTHPLHPES